MKSAYDIVKAPILTEKSYDYIAHRVYTFEVAKSANPERQAEGGHRQRRDGVAELAEPEPLQAARSVLVADGFRGLPGAVRLVHQRRTGLPVPEDGLNPPICPAKLRRTAKSGDAPLPFRCLSFVLRGHAREE